MCLATLTNITMYLDTLTAIQAASTEIKQFMDLPIPPSWKSSVEEELRTLDSQYSRIKQLSESMDTETGYIYCMSNPTMPGVYKIGLTEMNMTELLEEANTEREWGPPAPYVIELFKKASVPRLGFSKLYNYLMDELMEQDYNEKGYFTLVSVYHQFEIIKTAFDNTEGTYISF